MKNSVKNILKKRPENLNPIEQKTLKDFETLEESAKSAVQKFAGDLKNEIKDEGKEFNQTIEKSDLKEEDKKKATDLFSQMVLKRCEELSNKMFKELKQGEGILYNMMLSERVIDFLDIVRDFKASLDKILPIPLDQILKLASPFIMASIGISAPGIAVVLKTTGILDKAAEFLETKNLNNTIDKLKDGLEEVRKGQPPEFNKKAAEVLNEAGVTKSGLSKLGFGEEMQQLVSAGIKAIPGINTFVEKVTSYGKTILPSSETDIDNTLKAIKKSTIDVLEKANVSQELITNVAKEFDNSFIKVKAQLKPVLDPKVKLADKMLAQAKGVKMSLECANNISKIVEQAMHGKKHLATKVVETITKEVQTKMQGNVTKLLRG